MDEEKDITVMQNKMLNGVNYESIPETTIATSRTFKRQFFQKNSYTSSTSQAICDWNTGAEYVNPRRSYLALKVKTTGQACFGSGGVTNVIRRVVLTGRSGKELSRTEEYNRLMPKVLRYGCSQDYYEQFGSLMGYPTTAAEAKNNYDQLSTSKTFLIPLTMLSPFFKGDGSSLIPAQLAAGLRIELTLENDVRALVSAVTPTYEIEEISFMLNTTSLVDSWQRKLNEESAADGLTYTFSEWHTTQSTLPANQTQINIEVRKAVARALHAFVITQTLPDSYTNDNMKSDGYTASSVEWRLGSMYPTQQPIKNAQEQYFVTQAMWNANTLDYHKSNCVTPTSFINSTVATTGAIDGDALISVNLERNDVAVNGVLNIGGLPTNNSASLAVDITTPTIVSARQNFLFLKHLRVAKVYLDNVATAE